MGGSGENILTRREVGAEGTGATSDALSRGESAGSTSPGGRRGAAVVAAVIFGAAAVAAVPVVIVFAAVVVVAERKDLLGLE